MTDGGKFEKDKNGKYHYLLNNEIVKNAFFFDGTYTYYLQNDGTPMKDRLTYHPDGKHVIYFDKDGHEAFDQKEYVSRSITGEPVSDTCYFGTYGYMFVDQTAFEGDTPYYYNACGVMENDGWFAFADGNLGYAASNGQLMHNQFGYNPCGQKVYFAWNGAVAKGLIADNNYYYQMDDRDGHLIGAFQKDANAVLSTEPAPGYTIPIENYDFYVLGDNPVTRTYPNHNFLTYMRSRHAQNEDLQLWIYRTSDGGVLNSETHGQDLFLTNRGITVGSSKKDVLAAYGNPSPHNNTDITGACENGTVKQKDYVSPAFKELPQKEPGAAECLKQAVAYGEYPIWQDYDELMKDDPFSYVYFIQSGIRFYYDQNDTVIMIEYYSERSANHVLQ